MTLRQIEEFVLINISHKTRYEALRDATDDASVEDFSMLHRCVLLAREEIKLNVNIPSIQAQDTIAIVAGTQQYNLPSDFDEPIVVEFINASLSGYPLERLYPENIHQKLGTDISLVAQNNPAYYLILGESSNLIQIYLAPIPNAAGTLGLIYQPILTEITTATSYDSIMAKYPLTVIKFATAFAFQLIKANSEEFNKWYALGANDFGKLNRRELQSDNSRKQLPDANLRNRRMGRFSQ